jgi:FtsP/CotA-like multicopper oxidase with cupredoxin domain
MHAHVCVLKNPSYAGAHVHGRYTSRGRVDPDITVHTGLIERPRYNPAEGLPVRQGQRVRLRFVNKTEMFNPVHLHGHTFQVRGIGCTSPPKDAAIVLPKHTLEVDFDANNPGQWLTHCRNVYHGEAGMIPVVSYVE